MFGQLSSHAWDPMRPWIWDLGFRVKGSIMIRRVIELRV